jgi:hypothetical protein
MIQLQIGMDEVLKLEAAGHEQAYQEFKDKFKPKKTTDDCYTPENVYDVIAGWVANEYGLNRDDFVRPFYPGESYQDREYPDSCVVVDNPPFSILAEIITWYATRGIRFFLFGPGLTIFSARNVDVTYICTGADITYANGAQVCTSFVTNLDTCRARTAPDLYQLIKFENDKNSTKENPPKYEFPDCVITAAILQRWSKYGISYRLDKRDCVRISALDSMKEAGKAIYGGGYLLSEDAAAVRAEAEKQALEIAARGGVRTVWPISDRERRVADRLGNQRARAADYAAAEPGATDRSRM